MNRAHEILILGISKAQDILIMKDTGSVISGLEAARNEFMTVVKFAVNNVVIPIIAVAIGIAILFAVVACIRKHHGQETYTDKLLVIGICVAALVLVLSFPAWGWKMIGASSGGAGTTQDDSSQVEEEDVDDDSSRVTQLSFMSLDKDGGSKL